MKYTYLNNKSIYLVTLNNNCNFNNFKREIINIGGYLGYVFGKNTITVFLDKINLNKLKSISGIKRIQ